MRQKVKWGVIGSGGIARRRTIPMGIAPADNAELTAVYDVNPQINAAVADEFNARAVNDIDELLAGDVQAVYIATPVIFHYEQVTACAKAGKHVLCEKPLGMTVDQAQNAVRFCHARNVLLGCAFMMRFHTQHRKALEMIRHGEIGKPVFARAQLSCWYPPMSQAWRQDPALGGGGSLMDMGGHCIDLLEMFFGTVTKVSCFTNRTVHPYQSEDSAVVTLFFENGAIGTIDTFFCIPDSSSKNSLELYGSSGSILAKGTIGQGDAGEMIAYLENANGGYDAQQARNTGQGIAIKPAPANTYRAEIEDFSRALLSGDVPVNHATLGLRSQVLIEACYQSARTGRTVDIPNIP